MFFVKMTTMTEKFRANLSIHIQHEMLIFKYPSTVLNSGTVFSKRSMGILLPKVHLTNEAAIIKFFYCCCITQ